MLPTLLKYPFRILVDLRTKVGRLPRNLLPEGGAASFISRGMLRTASLATHNAEEDLAPASKALG